MTNAAAALASLTPAGSAPSAASGAQQQIAGNFDTFLKLLTTQLQYQDPMSPMDSSQFTSQLVQFAQVEQSIAANKNLESLVNFSLANATSAAVGYIGREVTAGGDTETLASDGSGAQWHYNLRTNAAETDISVVDSGENVIYRGQGDLAKGDHIFSWDGRTSSGGTAPAGSYKIAITAQDRGGNDIVVDPIVRGVVSSVDIVNGAPVLIVGGASLKISDVISVGPAPAPATTASN
jgi:flagellar basal-body rod modification protein FlgD